MPILWVFKTDVFVVQTGLCAIKIVENRFLRFLFTIHDMGIQGVKRGYRWLQGVTGGYKGLQGVKGVTKGYRELQGVTRGYKG